MTETLAEKRKRLIGETEFRSAMSRFASGLTIVATLDGGKPIGLTCQSFSSLSVDPQLILICVGRRSTTWRRIERIGRFTVSILADGQQPACVALGRPGPNKFDMVSWQAGADGSVRVDGALATIDCAIHAVHDAGDHKVVIGEVLDLSVSEDGNPLLYFRSTFATALV
jgi:3-hydroxy-9,10-secoandrosta-1,3,5(10)-triene-9,17-dione monooxygenase reductase component